MNTFIKWPGGKESELPLIRKFIPKFTGRYLEPFLGGGAVFFDTKADLALLNDRSSELISLFECVKDRDHDFRYTITRLYDSFRNIDSFISGNTALTLGLLDETTQIESFASALVSELEIEYLPSRERFLDEIQRNLSDKLKRLKKLEAKKGSLNVEERLNNLEASLKSAFYMYLRFLYNNQNVTANSGSGFRSALFFFIREYCYSSMFRYNKKGEFNVPYGGITYNRKDLGKKLEYVFSDQMRDKLVSAEFSCLDFEEFLSRAKPDSQDFVFLDPPYDSDFSTYAQNSFGRAEQERLHKVLLNLKARFVLVIKNTDFISELYRGDFNFFEFDKTYRVSFMNRNSKQVKHLLITNFKTDISSLS